jgi:hypothetical protein
MAMRSPAIRATANVILKIQEGLCGVEPPVYLKGFGPNKKKPAGAG